MTLATQIPNRKANARAALVDMKETSRLILSECFRQFGIETVAVSGLSADRLKKEKFEACVVKLTPGAETVMDAVRSSPSNNRMVIYGVGGSVQDAMKFSKYGINAVFNEPLERQTALKLVRSTQMLVLHEFRRYVRIPIITEVDIAIGEKKFKATSKEISSGGMSLKMAETLNAGEAMEVSFALLTLPRIWVKANVSWRNPAKGTFGIRFDQQDDRRRKIKQWVEAYLES